MPLNLISSPTETEMVVGEVAVLAVIGVQAPSLRLYWITLLLMVPFAFQPIVPAETILKVR